MLMTGLEGVELLGVTDKRFRDIDGRNNHPHPHPPPPASPPPLFLPSTANYSEGKKETGRHVCYRLSASERHTVERDL